MKLRFKKLDPAAITPVRKKAGDSGLDLHALLPHGPVTLAPGERARINTGIAIELPEPMPDYTGDGEWGVVHAYEAQVRGRSGLTNEGIIACGGLGTVDNGYRGDIGVTLFNHSFRYFTVKNGDRIAQLVVCPVVLPELVEVEALSETERGSDGFGSTGV